MKFSISQSYNTRKINSWQWYKFLSFVLFFPPPLGYVVQGSNGEFAYLDPDERIELVKKVKEYAAKEKLIIAGAACEGN